MTFRVDDLMVAVLPAHVADEIGCNVDSGTQTTDTNCADIHTERCPQPRCPMNTCLLESRGDDAPDAPKKKERAWREEQFALLSRELEDALAR